MKTYQTWDSFSATMTWNRSDLWGQRYPLNRSKGNHFWGTKLWIQANVTLKIIHLQQPLIQYLICITKPKTPKMMGILLKFILTWWSLDPFRAKSKATKPKILQKIKKTSEFLHHAWWTPWWCAHRHFHQLVEKPGPNAHCKVDRDSVDGWTPPGELASWTPILYRGLIDSRSRFLKSTVCWERCSLYHIQWSCTEYRKKARDVSMFRDPSRCHQMVD